ncbi:TonB-dependent receptor plug domain-containing protein [Nitrosomonas sp. HPC101]|uniref:TonB-dependent receptor plug domain-containing protein n=1 Tax=Nitrosomonas sp. HPC101 TaxID=1658667 RepID=UPI001371FD3E|nr:TonB-dependent receptor plug domain-containing protein [Nitrosomonas sp. HPC101]
MSFSRLPFRIALLATIAILAPQPRSYAQNISELPPITVQGQWESEYYPRQTATTTLKISTPIQDIPLSVQVVPQAIIADRQALTVRQALDTVSSVTSSNAVPGSQSFHSRLH